MRSELPQRLRVGIDGERPNAARVYNYLQWQWRPDARTADRPETRLIYAAVGRKLR
jgi:hypothetical protein